MLKESDVGPMDGTKIAQQLRTIRQQIVELSEYFTIRQTTLKPSVKRKVSTSEENIYKPKKAKCSEIA